MKTIVIKFHIYFYLGPVCLLYVDISDYILYKYLPYLFVLGVGE